jgi:hypothetical protein
VSDDELYAAVARLLALLEGLPDERRCACRRLYRIGCAAELQQLMHQIGKALLSRGAEVPAAIVSRFQLLEFD